MSVPISVDSVAALVATALRSAGYSTGQSPSPHLHSYRERVTIDGRSIDGCDLEPLLAEVLAANIANADTEGYSRQRTLLATQVPQLIGSGWMPWRRGFRCSKRCRPRASLPKQPAGRKCS